MRQKLLTVTKACRDGVVCALVDGDISEAIRMLQREHPGANTSELLATIRAIRASLEFYTIQPKRDQT